MTELIKQCQQICSTQMFIQSILDWHEQHGRKQLPWQIKPTPYHVWLSEVMLQQTQVSTVINYFQRFIEQFPDIHTLAKSSLDDVLAIWSGLGYYSRARNLHKTAQIIVNDYEGHFPETIPSLIQLPGIGYSTAGAIRALAMNQPAAILDGNVKRVLARVFNIEGWPGKTAVAKQLWSVSQAYTSEQYPRQFIQGIMDLGAMVCTKQQPQCQICPLQNVCSARQLQKQTILPGKKPAKKRPTHFRHMLILADDKHNIWLEKRPPTGIWGGLWSLPELGYPQSDDAIQDHVEHKLGLECLSLQHKPQLKHQFSHYQLMIQPVMARVKPIQYKVAETSGIWQPINNISVGLPQPIKHLLKQTKEQAYA